LKKRKTGENRIIKTIGALLSYLLAIASVTIFALYCSGRVGWFLLAVVIGAPLFSFAWTFASYWFISVGLASDNTLVSKGDYIEYGIKARNRWFIPAPDVTVYIKNDNRVIINSPIVSLGGVMYGTTEKKAEIFTVFAGLTEIEIDKVIVSDFFGVLKLKLRKQAIGLGTDETSVYNDFDRKISMGILPDIKYLEQEDEWLLSARSAAFDGEEPEDTVNDRSATFGGFPGYEHREYVPGDPLKRINYKLSARVGKLQVRLDEEQAVAGISMYLSPILPDDMGPEEPYIRNSSQCLEEFIAVAQHLFILDFAVKVYIPGREPYELMEQRSIEELREMLAFQKFEVSETIDESIMHSAKGSLIAFVVYQENRTIELLKKYSYLEGNTVSIYVSSIEKGRRL